MVEQWSNGSMLVSKCWKQSVPDWTLAYFFKEYLGCVYIYNIFNRIHLNALARNHRTPFHIYPKGVDVWINVHDCAWSNLSNHGSNSSQGNHGNHSSCRRFSESSGCNVGGTRFRPTRRAPSHCAISPKQGAKRSQIWWSACGLAPSARVDGFLPIETLCEENGRCRESIWYIGYSKGCSYLVLQSRTCLLYNTINQSRTCLLYNIINIVAIHATHVMYTSFSGCSYLGLQPIYGVFDKLGTPQNDSSLH